MERAYTTVHHGHGDKLGLAMELERFANDQWVGEHYSEQQAVDAIKDRFRRLIEQELTLIEFRLLR